MLVALLDPSAFTIPYDDHLCRGLAQAGCEVTFFTRPVRHDDYFSPQDLGGVEDNARYTTREHFYRLAETTPGISRVRAIQKGIKLVEHAWNMASLGRQLRRLQPDVIHFQWTVVPAVDRRFLKRLRTIAPCLLTVHDTNAFLAPSSRLQKIGWLPILHEFDRLIVHTHTGKQALVDKGIDQRRISVIPHGVFDCNTGPIRPPDLEAEQCTLLAFGSIKPYKGVDILLRAIAQLPEPLLRRVRLVVAGNPGGLEAELRGLASELGVEQAVEWKFGFIPDEQIPALFERSHAAVFPYREIDASGALMTALPYGRTIVASRLGLFAELLKDGETAYLVEPKDPAALAAAIVRLIENPVESAQTGQRAAALADNVLSWTNIARLTLEAYEAARSS